MISAPVVVTWAEFAAVDQLVVLVAGVRQPWDMMLTKVCRDSLGHPVRPEPGRLGDLPEIALMMLWSSIVPMNVAKVRHSFVSLLSDAGVPLENISRLVGHRATTVTENTYHRQLRPVIDDGLRRWTASFLRRSARIDYVMAFGHP